MVLKNILLFLAFIAIISQSLAQSRLRGQREYEDTVPASRSGLNSKRLNDSTIQRNPFFEPSKQSNPHSRERRHRNIYEPYTQNPVFVDERYTQNPGFVDERQRTTHSYERERRHRHTTPSYDRYTQNPPFVDERQRRTTPSYERYTQNPGFVDERQRTTPSYERYTQDSQFIDERQRNRHYEHGRHRRTTPSYERYTQNPGFVDERQRTTPSYERYTQDSQFVDERQRTTPSYERYTQNPGFVDERQKTTPSYERYTQNPGFVDERQRTTPSYERYTQDSQFVDERQRIRSSERYPQGNGNSQFQRYTAYRSIQPLRPMSSFAAENPSFGSDDSSFQPDGCSQCLDPKYMIHYYERGCKPVESELKCSKPCPKYFNCPKISLQKVKGCEYKGRVYRVGEKIQVDNPCKKSCSCTQSLNAGNVSMPTIQCADVECFNNFRAPNPNCYNVYEEGQCCPTEKCITDGAFTPDAKCNFEGKQYRLGERMYSKVDPCIECTCNDKWNRNKPLNSTGCHKTKCYLELNANFKAGCLPIYHENTCCPIEYMCPPPEEHHCVFGDRKYRIGERLAIDNYNRNCTCVVPPDFTCIERSRQQFTPYSAPTFAVNDTQDYTKKFQTLPRVNITNGTNDYPELGTKSKCAPFLPAGLTCAGTNCTTILDINGCQTCSCETPCPTLKCRRGCRLVATTPGVCPECKCD